MSFKINSDKENIRANAPSIIGDSEVSIRSGTGTDEKEVMRALLEPNTKTPRVGINRTGNKIDRYQVTNPGSGYTLLPTVLVTPPTGDNPVQALASAVLSPEGRVSGILIDNPGSGYTSAPSVSITGGNGFGATADAFLDTVDFELDINGAIRTSTSIISDTARILNLDIDNLVTPDAAYRAPNLKTFMNNTGTAWAADRLLQKDSFVYRGPNVYQAITTGTTSINPIDPPLHIDGTELNGNELDDPKPGVLFKHIGFRVNDPDEVYYNDSGEAGIYPRSITPILGDKSDKIATTEYVLNLATNDVGGRIYVSQQIGNDERDGRSPVNPVRTIKRACQLAWETPGIKETIIVAGGDYTEDNPISIPPDASVVGDNLRLVIIRPANPRKHIFKFGDKNYVIGVTYRDQEGADTFTWDFAMVFDDKQRITYDYDANGDFDTVFPVGHQIFGDQLFNASYQSNGGLQNLVAGIELRGVNAGGIVEVKNVTFTNTTGNGAYTGGTFNFTVSSGSINAGETLVYAGTGERFQPDTVYQTGNIVWTEDHVYNVSTGGTSGQTNPTVDQGTEANGPDTLEFTYIRDVYSLVTLDIKSIRPEGEVVFEGRPNLTDPPLPVYQIDFTQQGTFSGGFGDPGFTEDLGGIVFFTNPLVEGDNIHDFKEGEEIWIENLPVSSPDLSFLNGKQRIYKVIEDPDGRSRRFVIPKKLPTSLAGLATVNDFDPGEFATVRSYAKSATLSLLNTPFKFDAATPVARRFQDACNQIRNNREFIGDEVVKRINDEFKKEYFSVYDIGGGGGFDFKIFLGNTGDTHTYVSGGTAQFGVATYNITDFVYDNLITGEATITIDNSPAGVVEDDLVKLDGILVECNLNGITTQKEYPSFSIPVNDNKCSRDIKHFLNALIADLEFGSNNNIITAARRYIDGTNSFIDETIDFEIIQTVRAIEYARELAIFAMRKWRTGNGLAADPVYTPQYSSIPRYFDPSIIEDTDPTEVCANVRSAIDTLSYLFVDVLTNDASGTYLDAAWLIARNRHHIADEAYKAAIVQFPSLGLNNIDERKCRRDINYVISAVLRDLVLGGNFGVVSYAELYFTGTQLTGIPQSELGATRYAFEYVRDLTIQSMRNWKTATGNTINPIYTSIPQFTDLSILVDPNGTPTATLTPTDATYDTANGDFVMTFASAHGASTSEFIRLQQESFVFTCDMDNNRSEHYLPEADQPAGTQLLAITAVTTNTITVNVGASGPDVQFTPTDATYNPSTGDFTIEIGTHTLSNGEGIVLADNSFTFTCTMDGDDAQKTYPRPGIDPFAGRSLKITGTTADTITVNVGASGPNKYFQPSAATYDPATGVMEVNVGQHGLGVGRGVVLEDNSFTFTCLTDPTQPKTYPRPGQDPFAGKSIPITAVGSTDHSPSLAAYSPEAGTLTITLNGHNFSNGDYIKIDDDAITFTCDLDSGATQHTYPRSYEYASGRWFAITNVTTNTFQITGLPIPGDLSTHTFVSFAANSLKKQDGTFTINVGTSSDTTDHTFVSATSNAIKHEPQSVHSFISAAANAVSHLPQSTQTFKRVVEDNVVARYPASGSAHCANVEATLTTQFGILDDILSGAILPGATTKTKGTLYDVANLYTYADSTITDFNGNVITVKAIYDDFPIIEASPYTQNASIISKLGGSGALIDGSKVKQPNCPFPGLNVDGTAKFPNQGKSMVASAFTIVSEGGIGYKIIEDGYVQLVSVFCIFTADGVLAESGGYASVTNSASNFGIYSLRSTGFRREAYSFDVAVVSSVSSTPTGRTIVSVNGLGREPLEHYVVKFDGLSNSNPDLEYFVDVVEGVTVGPPFSAQLTLESGSGGPTEFIDDSTGNPLANANLVGKTIRLHRPSIVNSSSHTWEYAGSGTSYNALPENGGTKIEANEQVSENYGRTYVSGTDELGDFKVGTFARIENRTGNITFTGTVTISEVEFLKLKGGDVVVTGFDNSNTLGGSSSTDSKLPTQKAVKDYITNNLGPYIGLQYSTFPVPNALVQLTTDGKINEDQIPPLRPFEVYTVADEAERISIEGALAGDIAIQQDTNTSFILNNDNESLFASFAVDTTLQFTIGDIFTGSTAAGGKIQSTEYRQGVLWQVEITDGGSGYITPPVVTVSGGNPQAGAVPANITTTIANGQVVILNIELFNGYIGGKGYTTPPTITIAPPAGSGTQANAVGLIESRLYGDIVNNVKITSTDNIESSDLPPETIDITRVVNTSADNINNWVSLSSNQIAAGDITSGVIAPARLASNAVGSDSAANSFTFLRGDSSYAATVQTIKGPETRYFAKLKLQANSGSSQLVFESSSNFLKGHEVAQITGIQVDTNIDGVLTEEGETTVTLDKFLTATLPADTVLEFDRGRSPLTVESSQTEGGFVEEIVIQNGGSNFTDGTYFNVPLSGGLGIGLRANITVGADGATGVVTGVTIVNGGKDYGQNTSQINVDFVVSSSPSEIGGGSGLVLLAKVTTVLRQYANVTIDVDRVSDLTTSGDAYGTLGVARFIKSQFVIGAAGNGSVSINTGPDSGLDADTLDGAQGLFYLNSTNQSAGTLPVERLSGTYNINIANQSGSTLRLKSSDAPVSNNTPDEFAAGIIAETKNNSADGLSDGGSKHIVMTLRNGGSDFDATFGGVRQLAFTDASQSVGAGMWLRGSYNSPANVFGNWYEIWHSGNDGVGSGLDADRLDNRQGTWYQSAEHMDYGRLTNERLPILQREKDFLNKIRVTDWSGSVRVTVLVRDELLGTTPFLSGQSVNLYTPGGVARGSISITKVDPNQDVNDAANNYTLITGSLTSGDYNSFDDAAFIGTGGVGNSFRFQNWNVSQVDDNVDGDIDGTHEVIVGESVSGNARLRLGRTDGQASDPSIFFRSAQLTPTDYNVALIATGGNSTNASGSLEVKVSDADSLTVNGNKVWNAGNVQFNSTNVVSTAVIRDANGDFSAGTITANLTGSASNNVLKSGDTMTGALVISNVVAANQALQVSGRADFLSNITITADLDVDTKTFFVDASENKIGVGGVTDFANRNGQSHVKLRMRPSALDNYDDKHHIDFAQFNGNWSDGSSGPDTQWGMAFSYSAAIRGGLLYDHKGSERMALWSSYGRLAFMVDGAASGNEVPITASTEAMTIIKEGTIGINVINPSSTYKLDVNGQSRFRDFVTLDDAGDNSGTGLYFLGATGGADGSGGYLSNFRVANSIVGNDIFEITANDGTQGATTWKSTPALAIQGTNNRVAINSTTFQGQDNTDPNNIITRFYALNIEGDFNINNGNLFVDNKPFVTSRWTEAPNNTDIYRPTKVGVNFSSAKNPTESLDVEGSINVSGTLKANGQEQWIDQYGVVKVASASINEDLTISSGLNAFSFGPIGVGANNIVTIQTGATWVIL